LVLLAKMSPVAYRRWRWIDTSGIGFEVTVVLARNGPPLMIVSWRLAGRVFGEEGRRQWACQAWVLG
jgi:hypothetical protein